MINYFNEHLGDFIPSITPSIIHLIKPDVPPWVVLFFLRYDSYLVLQIIYLPLL